MFRVAGPQSSLMTRPRADPKARKHASAIQWWEGILQEVWCCKEPCCSASGTLWPCTAAAAVTQRFSREAACVLHNGSSGSKRFGICPRASNLFSFRGWWMYFLAGGWEITVCLVADKRIWMDGALIVFIQVTVGKNNCLLSKYLIIISSKSPLKLCCLIGLRKIFWWLKVMVFHPSSLCRRHLAMLLDSFHCQKWGVDALSIQWADTRDTGHLGKI